MRMGVAVWPPTTGQQMPESRRLDERHRLDIQPAITIRYGRNSPSAPRMACAVKALPLGTSVDPVSPHRGELSWQVASGDLVPQVVFRQRPGRLRPDSQEYEHRRASDSWAFSAEKDAPRAEDVWPKSPPSNRAARRNSLVYNKLTGAESELRPWDSQSRRA